MFSFERPLKDVMHRLTEYLIASNEGGLLLIDMLKACFSHQISDTDPAYCLHFYMDRIFGACDMDWSPEDEQVVVSLIYEISEVVKQEYRQQLQALKRPYFYTEIGHLELNQRAGTITLVVTYDGEDDTDTL